MRRASDPGAAGPVAEALAERQLELVAVLVTHHHADHTGGIEALLADKKRTPVFGPATVISASADGVQSVFAADLDGDGDNDVLSAAAGDISWYENKLEDYVPDPQDYTLYPNYPNPFNPSTSMAISTKRSTSSGSASRRRTCC